MSKNDEKPSIEQPLVGRGNADASKPTQFKEGDKSVKRGRPKGSKNRKTIIEAAIQTKLIDALEEDAEEIYRKAAEMAKNGDKTMIKLFLSRLLPELKAAGEDVGSKTAGGIQIVVNSYKQGEEKDVTPGVTINQIDSDQTQDENEDEEDDNA